MSMILDPNNPYGAIPTVNRQFFPGRARPYNNITPFTYRDGETYLEVQTELRSWLSDQLVPFIDETIEFYVNEFNKNIAKLSDYADEFQKYIASEKAYFDGKIDEYQALVDKATTDFIKLSTEAMDAVKKDADRAETARDAAETFAANTLALQDETMATLLDDPASKTIDSLNDAVVANFAESEVRLGRIPRGISDNPPVQFYDFAEGVDRAVSIENGGSGYSVGDIVTVSGGTNKTAAQFRVSSVNGTAIAGMTVYRRGAYKTPPSNPAAVTGGATATLAWGETPTQFTEGTAGDIVPTNPNLLFTGYAKTLVANGGYGNPDRGADLGRFLTWEWQSDAPRLEITLISNNARHQLFVDGKRVQVSWRTETNDGKQQITWMLDFGASRNDRVFRLSSRGGLLKLIRYPRRTTLDLSGNVLDPTIRFVQPQNIKPVIYGIGDSYMWGEGANEFSQTMFGIMCDQLGYTPQPEAITGAGWATSRGGSAVDRINATLANISRAPDFIVWELGYNDRNTSDMASIQSALNTAVARAKQLYPDVPQVMFGPATPMGNTTQLDAMRTMMQTRAAAFGINFVDVRGWITENNRAIYTSSDNVHPTPLGHAYLGARKAAAMRALFPKIGV